MIPGIRTFHGLLYVMLTVARFQPCQPINKFNIMLWHDKLQHGFILRKKAYES